MIQIHFGKSWSPTDLGFTGRIETAINFDRMTQAISSNEMNAEADKLADMRRKQSRNNNKTLKQQKFVEKIITCERRVRKLDKEYQAVCA